MNIHPYSCVANHTHLFRMDDYIGHHTYGIDYEIEKLDVDCALNLII
jgi:hypothetical protein